MLVVLESRKSVVPLVDQAVLETLQRIAQQPILRLQVAESTGVTQSKPNPPKQDPMEKRRKRREKHERKALMKEWKEPFRAQKVAEKLACKGDGYYDQNKDVLWGSQILLQQFP